MPELLLNIDHHLPASHFRRNNKIKIILLLILIALLQFGSNVEAQIKTNVKLTQKTQHRVNAGKAARKDIKRLSKKERRAQLRKRKEEELAWKLKSDSLRTATLYKREYQRQWTLAEEKYTPEEWVKLNEAGLLDFDTIPKLEAWDQYLLEELLQNKELLDINELDAFGAELSEWSELQNQIKDATATNPVQGLKDLDLNNLGYEGEVASELQDHFQSVKELRNQEQLQQQAREKVAQAGAEKAAEHLPQLEQAQKDLLKYKKKFSWLPSSGDLSFGQKENSLLGVPLKDRLVWGGYLQIEEGKPVRVDFSPQLSYFLNKKFSMGIGMTYRFVLGKEDSVASPREVPAKAFGGRFFTEVKAIYGFHVHAEYEALKTSKKELFGDKTAVKWNQGLMAGIGKTVNLTKGVKTGILLMYNFLHEKDGPYPRPWIIRFGFQF
jgi:hypothetical protein